MNKGLKNNYIPARKIGRLLSLTWSLFPFICLIVVFLFFTFAAAQNAPQSDYIEYLQQFSKTPLTQLEKLYVQKTLLISFVISFLIFTLCCTWAYKISRSLRTRYGREYNLCLYASQQLKSHSEILDNGNTVPDSQLNKEYYLDANIGKSGNEQSVSIMTQRMFLNAERGQSNIDLSHETYTKELFHLLQKLKVPQQFALRMGILFTFIGLFISLGQIDKMIDDSSQISNTLAHVVSGLSITFVTSIAGLTASSLIQLLINFNEKELLILNRYLDSLFFDLNNVFSRTQFSSAIKPSLEKVANKLVETDAKLDKHQKIIEDSTNQFAKKIETSFEYSTKQFIEVVETGVKESKTALNEHSQSIANQFKQSVEALTESVTTHDEQLFNSLSKSTDKVTKSLDNHRQVVTEKINDSMANINSQNNQITNAIASIGANKDAMESLRKTYMGQAEQFNQFLTNIKDYESHWDNVAHQRYEQLKELDSKRLDQIVNSERTTFETLNQETLIAFKQLSKSVVEDIAQANTLKAKITEGITDLRVVINDNQNAHHHQLELLGKNQLGLVKAIEQLSKTQRDLSHENKTTQQEMIEQLKKMTTSVKQLEGVSSKLRNNQGKLSNIIYGVFSGKS